MGGDGQEAQAEVEQLEHPVGDTQHMAFPFSSGCVGSRCASVMCEGMIEIERCALTRCGLLSHVYVTRSVLCQ